MGCYESLVKCKFLSNAADELDLARKTLKFSGQLNHLPMLPASKKLRKSIYSNLYHYYYIEDEIDSSVDEMIENKRLIYYINVDNIFFVYSMDKSQIHGAVQYALNIDGYVPLHQTKHKFKNRMVYTALFDSRLVFNPISPN